MVLEPLDSRKSLHGVQASNLPYHEALWGYAKQSTGIVGLCKSFSYTEPCATSHPRGGRKKNKKASVTVDIVAQGGLEWCVELIPIPPAASLPPPLTPPRIKVSLLTPRRLLFEIAKAGWEDATGLSDDSGDDDDTDGYGGSANMGTTTTNTESTATAARLAVASTSLSCVADNLLLAARQTRVQYLHPTITFILPRLPPTTTTPEVVAFLAMLQQKGITVRTPTPFLPAPGIEGLLSTLASPLARRAVPITASLNLDTTVLLALVSDISHLAFVPLQPHFHPAIQRQLDTEKTTPMVPCHLLPVLQHRALVTCVSSRRRFTEIVDAIATDSERERARLLLLDEPAGADSEPPLTPVERAARMARLSVYDCSALQLPVLTVPDHKLADSDPPGFRQVADKLSPINRAAFLTGWVRGLTTVTSNRAVAKVVEAVCGGGGGGEGGGGEQDEEAEAEVVGPDVWVVESARSLVCKAKRISGVAEECSPEV